MKLSVIIVHHKTPELLRLCLKSLKNYIPKEFSHEIIMVDSESTRESQDIVFEDYLPIFASKNRGSSTSTESSVGTDIKLVTFKENIGYAKGINAGILASSGQYILILNPDIIIREETVKRMLDFMEAHPKIGILGPQLLDFNGTVQRSYFRFYTPLTILARRTFLGKLPFLRKAQEKFLMLETNPSQVQHPDWIMGSALMISRIGIEQIGMMDERFFLYFEDVDWARRFWENGYKVVYYPEAKMYHYHQRRSRAGFDIFDLFIRKETRWHIKSAIKYFIKYGLRKSHSKKLEIAYL